MSTNKISAELSSESEDSILQSIRTLRESLPALVTLDTETRKRLAKLGRRNVGFVDVCVDHAEKNPQFMVGYQSLEEFLKDVNYRDAVRRIKVELDALKRDIDDTVLLTESETYQASRLFYKTVKAAAQEGQERAEAIAKELAFYHKRKRPVEKPPVEDPPPAPE
ncbi:MAG: hypothetical protein GY950_24820 [bacterium]|nr:hypothetical protein [bacterium]